MDVYAETILDHYRSPRCRGVPAAASTVHEERNLSCGDTCTVGITQDAESGMVTIGWEGEGCAISQAGMSLLAEHLSGKPAEEVAAFSEADMQRLLGVPVGTRRIKCALLGLHTLQNALRLHRGHKTASWNETLGQTSENG